MAISTDLYDKVLIFTITRDGSISQLPILILSISIFLTQNIGDIDILYCSPVWPIHIFIIASKVVSDIIVIS